MTCCYLEYSYTLVLHLLLKPHDLHLLPVLSDNMFQLFLLKLKITWAPFFPCHVPVRFNQVTLEVAVIL